MSPARGAPLWAALPDAITALCFACVWWSPFVFGEIGVRTAMLTMLVEFILIHGTGFFTAIGNMDDVRKHLRVLGMLALSVFYVAMIAAFAMAFGEWWPLLAFGWLLVAKITWMVTWPAADGDRMMGLMAAWAGSVAAYLAAIVATSVPESFPRWGMLAELQPRFGLGEPGGGLWVDEPHRVVAAGALYFGLLFLGKVLVAVVRRRPDR